VVEKITSRQKDRTYSARFQAEIVTKSDGYGQGDNDINGLKTRRAPIRRAGPGKRQAVPRKILCGFRVSKYFREGRYSPDARKTTRFAMIFTVAIDGPAAAGKGTISRAVADRFGFRHLDTGLLYRAVGAIGGDPVQVARALRPEDLNRHDLRTLAAGQAASRVAAIPEVRAALVAFQRRFARDGGGAVLDGRDIGTVICPEAEVKLYVTASPEVRAHRRWLEVGGEEPDVLAEVRERDARDMGRADAPLRPAENAVVIDTSDLGVEEAVEVACAIVAKRLPR
jgi:CMP/dCMP kinase